MTTLTERLQQTRFTIVHVDHEQRRIRVKDPAMCSDLLCHDEAVVITDDGTADLTALHPGDIVRLESADGRARRIVVLRRVWDELSSPEF